MIAAAASWLIGLGVPAKLARPLLGLAAFLLALGLTSLVWNCAVDNAVEQEQAERRAETAETARKADNAAADTQRADDARNRAERAELEGVPDDESDRSLTDGERALLRCVRLQQSARARGEPAPAC